MCGRVRSLNDRQVGKKALRRAAFLRCQTGSGCDEAQAHREIHRVAEVGSKVAVLWVLWFVFVHGIEAPIVSEPCLCVEPDEPGQFFVPHDPGFQLPPLQIDHALWAIGQVHPELVALEFETCLQHAGCGEVVADMSSGRQQQLHTPTVVEGPVPQQYRHVDDLSGAVSASDARADHVLFGSLPTVDRRAAHRQCLAADISHVVEDAVGVQAALKDEEVFLVEGFEDGCVDADAGHGMRIQCLGKEVVTLIVKGKAAAPKAGPQLPDDLIG